MTASGAAGAYRAKHQNAGPTSPKATLGRRPNPSRYSRYWGTADADLSAYAEASEREKAMTTGCDEFDAKPIEFESLITTVRRVLAKPK